MSTAIRPFEKIKRPLKSAGLASVRYVERRLREVLGKLHFTGSAVREGADGQIHIEVQAGTDSGDHPFKVERASSSTFGVTVQPGLVFTNTLTSGLWTAPVIGGVSLLNDPAPVLTANATESHICLVVEIGTDGKATNLPWEIKAFNSAPSDTTLIRLNSASGTPRAGKYHILIASIYSSAIYQWTRLNIGVELQWEVLSIRA